MTAAALFSLLVACGPDSNSNSEGAAPTPTPVPAVVTGTFGLLVSDASTEDWATVGVKVRSIAVIPQGGGAPVAAYTAPSPAPTINLVQLDQLAELLGNVTVPVGTYTGASITIGANSHSGSDGQRRQPDDKRERQLLQPTCRHREPEQRPGPGV
jgi:hypothetical protein